MKLPEDVQLRVKVMQLKKEVMTSVLSAGVRINDGALRKKEDDKVARLLNAVKRKIPEPVVSEADDDPVKAELFS